MSFALSLTPIPTRGWAEISPCGRFRYLLGREWDPSRPRALFVMLNPSTASGDTDDPTIRRCISFARGWDHGSLEVVNLYAFRATEPGVLKKALRAYEDVGDGAIADAFIAQAALRATTIVLAWGAHASGKSMSGRAQDVIRMLEHRAPRCFGRSSDGSPRHPLMLAASTALEPFAAGRPL